MTSVEKLKPRGAIAWRFIAAGLAVAFGIATLAEGGPLLFGDPALRAEAGDVVQFVLVFNFSAAFLYVIGGLATFVRHPGAVWVARVIAITTLIVFAAFGVHVLRGGAYEVRTVFAMTLRSAFWVAQALALPTLLRSGRRS